jgi:hypothetical protein
MDLQFRLQDGTLIGPHKYAPIVTIGDVKETILARWPPQELKRPGSIEEMSLICGGKELRNKLTLAESTEPPPRELSGGYITRMHVLVHPPRPPTPPEGESIPPLPEPEPRREPPPRTSNSCHCMVV